MKAFENVFMLDRILRQSRHPVTRARIAEALECSDRSAKRTIEHMRKYFEAPIEYSHDPAGYYYSDAAFEMPGLWFSSKELQALIIVLHLLQVFQPGLFQEVLDPLRKRLDKLGRDRGLIVDVSRRARMVPHGAYPPAKCFDTVAAAAMQRRRLSMTYTDRETGKKTKHEVSPQHLLHYRDNWYIDTWCHKGDKLRTFDLTLISGARMLETAAVDIPEAVLDAHFTPAYGLSLGPATATAILRFSPHRARWIDGQIWHPLQKAYYDAEGYFILEIPYNETDELVPDILRHGAEVEVMSPAPLRDEVAEKLWAAAGRYPRREGVGVK